MRAVLAVALLLLAGCLAPTTTTPAPVTNATVAPEAVPEPTEFDLALAYFTEGRYVVQNITRLIDDMTYTQSGHRLTHIPSEEANATFLKIADELWTRAQAWNETKPPNATLTRHHDDIWLAARMTSLSATYAAYCVRYGSEDDCDKSKEAMRLVPDLLEDATAESRRYLEAALD